jgi:antitoxin (DNA-binding transcriptional repressor) of toxin-antitoxin stability system
MTREVSIYNAKNQLSKLMAWAEQGETVIITKNGTPMVQLTYIGPKRRPVYGLNAGNFPSLAPEAFAALGADDEREFYGE